MTELSTSSATVDFSGGWSVLQDVYDLGERLEIWRRAFDPMIGGPSMSPWQPIERLDYLQLLMAEQPYFGRQLRYFNQAPWYYKLEFATPAGARQATLRFEGVDYYAKVWLNERLLGEHEGHASAFEFEVGDLLEKDKPNLLIVRVHAPWDVEKVAGDEIRNRSGCILRNMIKGSYEHADTFVQRDVNPVGIWRPVTLVVHEGLTCAEPFVRATPSDDFRSAEVEVTWDVTCGQPCEGTLAVRIVGPDGTEAARTEATVRVETGTPLEADLKFPSPRLWSTWDRGGANLYRAEIELRTASATLRRSVAFGVRKIELRRTKDETTFLLNGQPIFLRGATYWPDVYVSRSDAGRYERDVRSAIAGGMNALRIHVHVENDAFYDVCDALGVLVLQDFEINWAFPTDDAFAARATAVCSGIVKRLRNHPSIFAWACMNEAFGETLPAKVPQAKNAPLLAVGSALQAMCRELDPSRPTIRNSGVPDDLEAGDSHNYIGSLASGEFLDIYGTTEKLNTEFGFDAPPSEVQLRRVPVLHRRLGPMLGAIASLHDYQYYFLKYFMEHYRMQKYAPCSGYFQFMWIDFCPQSLYGVYDYWGQAKAEGLGGGLQAMRESNQPVGVFLEFKDAPVAIHACNDLPRDLGPCRAEWRAFDGEGRQVAHGEAPVRLGPDSHACVCDVKFEAFKRCRIALRLTDASGAVLAENAYVNPFDMPRRPKHYPQRFDAELGMRTWGA